MRDALLLRRDRPDWRIVFLLFRDTLAFCFSLTQRRLDRAQEHILVEGFQKALHGAGAKNERADRLVSMRRNKNDGDRMLAREQLSLKFGTAHSRHTHIENQ